MFKKKKILYLSRLVMLLLLCGLSLALNIIISNILKVEAADDKKFNSAFDTSEGFAYGSGSGVNADNAFLIATPQHLDNVRNYLYYKDADSNYCGYYFKMIADIDLEVFLSTSQNIEKGFLPIGAENTGYLFFAGDFNGNGHTISNLWINRPNELYTGLFHEVTGKISNLRIVLSDKGLTGSIIGGIAGLLESGINNAEIINCSVTGNIKLVANSEGFAGGIVGWAYHSEITQSYFNGTISNLSNKHILAGIGGLIGRATNAKIMDCYVRSSFMLSGVDFNSTNILGEAAGGLCGIYSGEVEINNCFAYIISQQILSPYVGNYLSIKILGPVNCLIRNCRYNLADYISENRFLIYKIEQDKSKGLNENEIFKRSYYENWNFDTIWGIYENDGTPYLKIFNNNILIKPVGKTYNGNDTANQEVAILGCLSEEKPISAEANITGHYTDSGSYSVEINLKSKYTGYYQIIIGKYEIRPKKLYVIINNHVLMSNNINLKNLSYTIIGFVDGEDESVIKSGSINIFVPTDKDLKRGKYEINISGDFVADNYIFEYQSGTLTISGLYTSEIISISSLSLIVSMTVLFLMFWFIIKKRNIQQLILAVKKPFIRIQIEKETIFVEKNNIDIKPFPETFTKREREIAFFLLSGQKRNELTKKLFISESTLKKHILSIYKKTDCSTRAEFISKYHGNKEE